jgi:hypothetical protein
MRQMVWDDKLKMRRCSECAWVSPNPALDFQNRTKEEWEAHVKGKFDEHDCKKYPLKPKPISG